MFTRPLRLLLASLVACLVIACTDEPKETPISQRDFKNPVVDYSYRINGVTIEDEYQWLEDRNSDQFKNWIQQQKKLTEDYFNQSSYQGFNAPLLSEPYNNFVWADKLANYYFLASYSQLDNEESWQLFRFNFIDQRHIQYDLPLAANETPISFKLSPNGRFVAIQMQINLNYGKHFQWRIFDFANQTYFQRQFSIHSNSTNLQWLSEHNLLYSNQQQVLVTNLLANKNLDNLIFTLNEPTESDGNTESNLKALVLSAKITPDKKHLVVSTKTPNGRDKVWIKNLSKADGKALVIIDKLNADFEYLTQIDSKLYFLTNLSATRNRIISIDLNQPERRHWKEVVPQDTALLLKAQRIENQWLLYYKDNTRSKIYLTSLRGEQKKALPLNASDHYQLIATANHQGLSSENPILFLVQKNIYKPSEIIKVSLNDHLAVNISKLLQENLLNFDAIKQQVHFFRSEDASRIPVTLIAKDEIKRNSPLIMLANNGDGSDYDYQFNPLFNSFIQAGGTLALVHNRGGSTYGKNWVLSATGTNRVKIVEDLIAAQDWLLDKNYTQADQFAVYATSKNASSIAHYLNQPQSNISTAIFPIANFDLLSKADGISDSFQDKTWSKLFNYSNDAKSIERLMALDPIQNIHSKSYPAILLENANNQASQLKFLAKLQNHQTNSSPIVLLNENEFDKANRQLHFLKKQMAF